MLLLPFCAFSELLPPCDPLPPMCFADLLYVTAHSAFRAHTQGMNHFLINPGNYLHVSQLGEPQANYTLPNKFSLLPQQMAEALFNHLKHNNPRYES